LLTPFRNRNNELICTSDLLKNAALCIGNYSQKDNRGKTVLAEIAADLS
jgi:hypothetical protein